MIASARLVARLSLVVALSAVGCAEEGDGGLGERTANGAGSGSSGQGGGPGSAGAAGTAPSGTGGAAGSSLVPPAGCRALGTRLSCEASAGCRWLTPGCEMPSFPELGCFSNDLCDETMPCPAGEACTVITYNPCDDYTCQVCSATASVCR